MRQSLLGQFLLMGVLPAALVLLALIVLNGARTRRSLEESARREAMAEAVGLANELNGWNQTTIAVVRTMVDAAEYGLFGDRARSLRFLRAVLQDHPEYEGAYYTYEPDADGRDAASLDALRRGREGALPPEALDDQGRFIPYFFRDNARQRQIAMKRIADDMANQYYQGPKRAFAEGQPDRPELTEPYAYEGVLMTECTMALTANGRFAGIAGVDRGLSTLQRRLQAIAERTKLNVMLLTARNRFIVAAVGDPMDDGALARAYDDLKARAIDESLWKSTLPALLDNPDQSEVVSLRNPVTGVVAMNAEAHVPTGDWRVVIEVPPARLDALVASALLENGVAGLAGAGLVLALLVLMAVRLSRRIREAAEAARVVSQGDLTRSYQVRGGDEASELLISMNQMTGRLNELVSRVRGVTLGITGTATELGGASRHQEEVAQGFGASSAQIAAAVRQISATGAELLRGMEQLVQAASDTARLAKEGREGLSAMASTMEGLNAATSGVAERLAAIHEKAGSINAIVDTIVKVADQTNLLSVNAAIEAEKAGESGRGFLVVAREIRRLADQTAGATLDIETTVRQMQGAVSGGVMEMDRFREQVRRGVGTVGEVGQRLTQVIDRVGGVESRFGEITEGMHSQVQGAEQIRQSMDALAQSALRAREAAGEFAQASATLQESLSQLRSAVGLFKLRDGA